MGDVGAKGSIPNSLTRNVGESERWEEGRISLASVVPCIGLQGAVEELWFIGDVVVKSAHEFSRQHE
jgi:hypothetical protein